MKRVLQSIDMGANKEIDQAFEKMIHIRGIHDKLGITSSIVRNHRYNLKNGINISTDTKAALLKKYGWKPDHKSYSKDDLAAFFRYYNRTSEAKRELGIEHVFEQWELTRK